MSSTAAQYQIISRDISKSLINKAAERSVALETKYFADHIGSVKSVDDFIGNARLFAFAMRAFGLEDMTYAKGFMKKVLLGEPDANGHILVNRLQDSRYRDFANAFNFRSYGEDPSKPKTFDNPEIAAMMEAIGSNKPIEQRRSQYDNQTERDAQYILDIAEHVKSASDIAADRKLSSIIRTAVGLPPASEKDDIATQASQIESKFDAATFGNPTALNQLVDQFVEARKDGRRAIVDSYFRPAGVYAGSDAETEKLVTYFKAKAGTLYSAADIVADGVLTDIVWTTLGLPATTASKDSDAQAALIAKKLDVLTLRDPRTLSQFLDRFKDARNAARTATIDAYVQQTLESDVGAEDQGTRLALYFRRQAGNVKSAYGILADKALAEVVRTVLGLSPETARSNIDSQAAMINRKIDISSFKDPEKLDKFIKRFTIMWDQKNDTASTPTLSLFGGSDSGFDTGLLLKLQSIRLGGH
ncbi:DUF1217 domain-containing protein [Methylobacterium sp. B1]|uniref:DUF1217 domain-containing protein n=1 Tax=Methylobacterium sp. B1 TaxID=91459 RepID=UPI00034B5C08|nr:DUF1217 domain-containing protein [Methylobacterium sp. B1]